MKRTHGVRTLFVLIAVIAAGCSQHAEVVERPATPAETVPASTQREGDPEAGLEYLLYGNYVGAGLPERLYANTLRYMREENADLPRRGRAAYLPSDFNLTTDHDGARVVAGVNCLGCHASRFGNDYIIGLANSHADWTDTTPVPTPMLRGAAALLYRDGTPERTTLDRFLRGVDALGTDAATPFRGINPAFRIEELSAAHRDPATLAWVEEHVYDVPDRHIATDVPAWWHLKKKNALYYNGMGRGDFAKLIGQISLVGLDDAEQAQQIATDMVDLLAVLRTIEPPVYPHAIDEDLTAQGRAIFEASCSACHGTYGSGHGDPDWTYPNRLVPVDVVGTDPVYARTLMTTGLTDWYNQSWYATSDPPSRVEPTMVYIAPPLDGIWITAPYLHNGSVPTLEALLDSSQRPTYWRRTFDPHDYDHERVGWNYTALDTREPGDVNTYDTTLDSYGNQGHTFGDDLTDEERTAVIEYLKAL